MKNKTFELKPIDELLAIVRNSFSKLDDEGLIDEGRLVKVVMACNDKLGINIRDIKQVCIPVHENKAKLPLNFEKLYFVSAVSTSNTLVHQGRNPFDNHFDRDVIYEADIDRGSFGNDASYNITIKRETQTTIHNIQNFVNLEVNKMSSEWCHPGSPCLKNKGKYSVTIDGEDIITPFRSGEIYIMYLASMQDEEGNILFPFHPLITPYYEWSIVEQVCRNAIYNSDGNYAELFKLAQSERVKAWIDAFNMTTEKGYGELVDLQRRKELAWHNQYFRFFT